MIDGLKERVGEKLEAPDQLRQGLRRGRSPFTAKSVWLAAGLCIGAGSTMASGPAEGAIASWFQGQAPSVMTVAGSYIGGFFIGWGARRTLKVTSIITGVVLAVIGLFASWGWDTSAVQSWIDSGSVWIGENVEGAGRYLVSLLPSATSAGAGGVLGFRRK